MLSEGRTQQDILHAINTGRVTISATELVRGEGALQFQPAVLGKGLELLQRVLLAGKGTAGVDPLGEGLQVREHPVDRAVGEAALPVLVQLAAQNSRETRGVQRRRSSEPISLRRNAMNSRKSRACSFRDRSPVVTSVAK